ncbi:hypothetical protein PRIPAC_80550 [Pristionchus pacificus]|uniref:Uncharacterized protein n=1 Tax=Pristionchus pacificus TaxID=54126 RepID=A0A2A6CPJ7_PRIPA|nr:hypothetical protein PRIPAC_80550 [Pristionchus pacificus]|eukprot:PDM79961.1 hypothetical protein PRIPAC_32540 [Pristionchus pacificus]
MFAYRIMREMLQVLHVLDLLQLRISKRLSGGEKTHSILDRSRLTHIHQLLVALDRMNCRI